MSFFAKPVLTFCMITLFTVWMNGHAHAASPLQKVEPAKVCMVTDTYFGTEQIPVEVAGATYYGCCEGCKKTLKTEEKARFAIDPHSNKKVDKAKAVIGKDEKGRVYYFETEANLKSYSKN